MVSLLDLTIELSRATDMISTKLNDHQRQVAYIAYNLAEELDYSEKDKNDLVIAGILHDIGGLSVQERLHVLNFEVLNPHRHGKVGWLLLKNYREFQEISKIIKHHHVDWDYGKGRFHEGEEVSCASHLLHFADRISTSIMGSKNRLRDQRSLAERLDRYRERKFQPKMVDAFHRLWEKEYFWYDVDAIQKGSNFYKQPRLQDHTLNLPELLGISKLFARIIDFRSRFTAVHSEGVAAVAKSLGKAMDMSEEEVLKLEIGGYLHDIGKLTVPPEILEKPGPLTEEEFQVMKAHTYHSYVLLDRVKGMEEINGYASMHHERLDGTGYPFKKQGHELSLGAKIMAVADVYTAITENRPYRKGMEEKKALQILGKMKDRQEVDPAVVKALFHHREYVRWERIRAQDKARDRYQSFAEEIAALT